MSFLAKGMSHQRWMLPHLAELTHLPSFLYVGVYIGEAVSGQIAVAFARTDTPWNKALIAIGIVGVIIGVLIRVLVREPARQTSLVRQDSANQLGQRSKAVRKDMRVQQAYRDALATFQYLMRMRSFWLLVLSASFRQLAGNVFGYYMPAYLSALYPSYPDVLSKYGIIVGVVGSVAVLLGGFLTSFFWSRTKVLPLYLVAIGGMVSSIFVFLMIFSLPIEGGKESSGIKCLYGSMSLAYLTAELWLGAINSVIALLLPPFYKTFGIAIWGVIQVLLYSTGPEIIGLALRDEESSTKQYLIGTRVALAVIIPCGYWIAGIGFLCSIPLVRRDLLGDFIQGDLGKGRLVSFFGFGIFVFVMVVILFVVSIVYRA